MVSFDPRKGVHNLAVFPREDLPIVASGCPPLTLPAALSFSNHAWNLPRIFWISSSEALCCPFRRRELAPCILELVCSFH